MQANNPNHQTALTPVQLELIARMGTTPNGIASAKSVFRGIEGVFSLPTIFRRLAEIKERENIPQRGLLPVSILIKYVYFKSEQFCDIIVREN